MAYSYICQYIFTIPVYL